MHEPYHLAPSLDPIQIAPCRIPYHNGDWLAAPNGVLMAKEIFSDHEAPLGHLLDRIACVKYVRLKEIPGSRIEPRPSTLRRVQRDVGEHRSKMLRGQLRNGSGIV